MYQQLPQMAQTQNMMMTPGRAGLSGIPQVKVSFDGDTRLWRCSRLDDNQGLQQFIANSWPYCPLIAQYQDAAGDLMTITSDHDLVDAFYATQFGNGSPLRIFVRKLPGGPFFGSNQNMMGNFGPMMHYQGLQGNRQRSINSMISTRSPQFAAMMNNQTAAGPQQMTIPMAHQMATPLA